MSPNYNVSGIDSDPRETTFVLNSTSHRFMSLKAAFLAMEPSNCFISLARQIGGGSLNEEVQNFILELCIENYSDTFGNHSYAKNILKKVINAAESMHDTVADGFYEHFIKMAFFQEYMASKESNKIFRKLTFFIPLGIDDQYSLESLVVPLRCSLNLLEGDTGCAIWPSSLFLSEVIISYPKWFSGKVCLEVGSGVGLVGIALAHVGASDVILTDGDRSSLENLQFNLELNDLTSKVHSQYLPWELATECELSKFRPHIVLGADVIYDPKCVPHLVRVLRLLLARDPNVSSRSTTEETKEASVAYIAAVIRNKDTFDCFMLLAKQAGLSVLDITEGFRQMNLLPYMLSYDRSTVHLFEVSIF